MDFKIIETDFDLPDVLVYRDKNDDDEDIVRVLAIGMVGETRELIFSQVIQFVFPEYAKSFVRDYSRQSAIEFCKLNNLTNQ